MVSSTAILASKDIEATLAYYRDVLGFESTWTHGEPVSFGGASIGGVSLFFNLQPELVDRIHGHQHWIKVDDTDQSYAKHKAAGAKIVDDIENKPWGFREYVVEDINGYYLRFAGPPTKTPPKSNPFPDSVRIERRVPTSEEYERVAGEAFGTRLAEPGVLEGTWNGVVATVDGEAVGVVRIMRDAPGWFSIWDVAVLPAWQANRIGFKMMEEALEMIKAASPGANVFLFTFHHAFYEKLGFGLESASLKRV